MEDNPQMRPAYAGYPVATALLIATFVIWMVIEVRQGLHRRPEASSSDRGSLLVLRLSAVAGGLLAATALRVTATAYPYTSVAFGLSLAVIWTGVGLRWWSFRSLGRYFTFTVMTSADQPVITSGPYRLLRHPSYTGLLLILFGIGLTLGNWLSAAALLLVPLAGFINRIRVEEAALSSTLGPRYTTYARGHKRLVPFVW